MKTDGDEAVELAFECGASEGSLECASLPGLILLKHQTLTATVAKTTAGVFRVPRGMNALCINYHGTLIAKSTVADQMLLIPPQSLTFVQSAHLSVRVGRGPHHTVLLSWSNQVASLLDVWLQAQSPQKSERLECKMVCKPIDSAFRDSIDRYQHAVNGSGEVIELLLAAFIYEVLGPLTTGGNQVQFAAIPKGLPETVLDLVTSVRRTPSQEWTLKDAANRAGYSQFHFSRVFKSLIGYGFHEFVDRCRTESAVELLCSTDHPVDVIASTCGFGTTQSLRESVKKYLGLVPSELRGSTSANRSRE